MVKSRREAYAQETRRALLRSATRVFARSGYAAASLDDVVRGARLTTGAVYHHFGGKAGLFTAVFEELEADLMKRVETAALSSAGGPWEQAEAALDAFLDASVRPEYLQIALRDAPTVLPWSKQREIDARGAVAFLHQMLAQLMDAGVIEKLPLGALSRVWLGMLTEAAQSIAHADDREKARRDARTVLLRLLRGLHRN